MQRLTHERSNGIRSGYWSPNRKEQLIDALADYENLGYTPQELRFILDQIIPEKFLELMDGRK